MQRLNANELLLQSVMVMCHHYVNGNGRERRHLLTARYQSFT